MKRLSSFLASISVLLVLAVPAFSGEMKMDTKSGYGAAGCGLGSMLFGNEPGAVQIVAATTNGTLGNQTFGITTGTSNCGKGVINMSENNTVTRFVENNMDNLAKDISKGHGESLDTLAELTGISEAQKPQVFAKLQANFSSIFSSEKVQVADVVNRIVLIVKG